MQAFPNKKTPKEIFQQIPGENLVEIPDVIANGMMKLLNEFWKLKWTLELLQKFFKDFLNNFRMKSLEKFRKEDAVEKFPNISFVEYPIEIWKKNLIFSERIHERLPGELPDIIYREILLIISGGIVQQISAETNQEALKKNPESWRHFGVHLEIILMMV